jgi:hypothetical protein
MRRQVDRLSRIDRHLTGAMQEHAAVAQNAITPLSLRTVAFTLGKEYEGLRTCDRD